MNDINLSIEGAYLFVMSNLANFKYTVRKWLVFIMFIINFRIYRPKAKFMNILVRFYWPVEMNFTGQRGQQFLQTCGFAQRLHCHCNFSCSILFYY